MRRLRRSLGALVLCALVGAAIGAASAHAAFGLKNLSVGFADANGSPVTAAGTHPFALTTSLEVNTTTSPELGEVPEDALKDLAIELPPGLVGNPSAVPPCPSADFIDLVDGASSCLDSAAVGVAVVTVGFESPPLSVRAPVYNLVAPPGDVAKVGFVALGVPVSIDLRVKSSAPYNVVASLENVPQAVRFYASTVSIWGNPASEVHDSERGECVNSAAGGKSCPVLLPEEPFLTMPRRCAGPLRTTFEASSWQNPGAAVREVAETDATTGCAELGFAPEVSARPTAGQAESASGLDYDLDIDDQGLTSPGGTARSDIEKAVVTLPQGMTANPSVANGLAVCTKADFERETIASAPGQGCPEAAKIGSAEVETPLLKGKLLRASVYVAQEDDPSTSEPGAENPFDSFLAIYMVIKDPGLGILVKLPGRVVPNALTGQLVTTFGEPGNELPQFPFSHFRFHFRDGARAPLVTPPLCGGYSVQSDFTPWAKPASPLGIGASFAIASGVAGGPCPGGLAPFHPGFEAGSINNNAASYAPFFVRLSRNDGEQEITRFSSILPRGVLGKIAGLGKCSDAAIAAAGARSGRAELAAPSCPERSRIGRTLGGAGVGATLTQVPGSLYLAGPYRGDPLSVVAITPAVAGPFDVGTVVVREGLDLDRETAEVRVNGSQATPIPHILKGIPLKLRDLRIYVDRPNFTLNPTSCRPSRVRASVFGSFLDPLNPADDAAAAVGSRYQAANCARLGFKPRLSLKLSGGARRGEFPALKAVVVPRPGDANIGGTVVTLPHSAFLEQSHIRTICTRVQFSADRCPRGSIYGHVKARTPLLDETVEGPVYLRSSKHPLPDLVFVLRGVVEVDVVARIDSTRGRIRTTLDSVPDVPVTRFVLEMQGGRKGLIVNSRNLCRHRSKAVAELIGQNGRTHAVRPLVKPSCGGKKLRG